MTADDDMYLEAADLDLRTTAPSPRLDPFGFVAQTMWASIGAMAAGRAPVVVSAVEVHSKTTMPRSGRASRSQDQSRRGFIHAYGLFWNADEINWWRSADNRDAFRMFGRVGKRGESLKLADFRFQRGIYVLFDDYGPYYVGLTRVGTLGNRLKQHRRDSHAGRWDRFSWFGFCPVLGSRHADGSLALGKVHEKLLTDSKWAIRDLETLMIRSLGTQHRGNSHQMTFARAQQWEQVMAHETDRYLERLKKPPPSRAVPSPRPRGGSRAG